MLSDFRITWIVAVHRVGNIGNRIGLKGKITGTSLGHVVELFVGFWIFRFWEKMELKLIDVGIMDVTEAINVHEIVNFSTFVEKADLLLYTLYLNIF